MKIRTQSIIASMWAQGMPATDARFAHVYRAAIKAGLTSLQATALVKDAYLAARGYEWKLSQGSALHHATQVAQAALHPQGKCAEDLLAAREGRASRWGTEEFHRAP
jgi:hypothetical protein